MRTQVRRHNDAAGNLVTNSKPGETKRAYRSCIDNLIAFIGFDDVTRLTADDVWRWCGTLKQRGGCGIRIRDGYLAAVKAVLYSAVTAGHQMQTFQLLAVRRALGAS
jgi:hypothetical protein